MDNGTGVCNGLTSGKYIVGVESTLLNVKSLSIGRYTLGEQLQPGGTSFVYFVQDTNWYLINHLPLIGFNLGGLPLGRTQSTIGHFTVDVNESGNAKVEFKSYSNPLIGIFTVENFEATQLHLVYDINRRVLKFQ